MIYGIDELARLKGDIKDVIKMWADGKIEQLFGKGSVVGHYMKRGVRNYMERIEGVADKSVDMLSLFAAEDGKIDTDTFIDDVVSIFKEMDKKEYQLGNMLVEYGKGEVVITIPHSLVYDMVFGKFGTIKITADDILEIKELMHE
jgi:hypothetical protein